MLRSFLRDTRGAAAAEMALMLPLLMVVMFVTFEGGYFLWNQQKVVKGVRDGARYAGRLDFNKFDCTAGSVKAVASDAYPALNVTDTIKNVTRTGYPSGDNPNVTGADNPVIQGWANASPGVTVTLSCVGSSGGLYGAVGGNAPRVTVTASAPYPVSPITGIAAALGVDIDSIRLNASAQSPVVGL